MFEKTQHALSNGFKDLCVPSNAATVEQEHRDLLGESNAFRYKERVASLNRSPAPKAAPLEPAGYRVPRPFKKTLVDKMPDWIEKYRSEGLEDAEIDQILKEKQHKYIEKWGNKSRVGVLLNSYNQKQT